MIEVDKSNLSYHYKNPVLNTKADDLYCKLLTSSFKYNYSSGIQE